MKNLIISALSIGIGMGTIGLPQAQADSSCFELYEKTAQYKKEDRAEWAEVYSEASSDLTPFSVGAIGLSLLNPAFIPIAGALGVTQLSYKLISLGLEAHNDLIESRESRVLSYAEKAKTFKGFMKRSLRAAQKENPDTTMDDVVYIINYGFESGDFCRDGKLYGPRKIKKYVKEFVKIRS